MESETFIVAIFILIFSVIVVVGGIVFLIKMSVHRAKTQPLVQHQAQSRPKYVPTLKPTESKVYASPTGKCYHSDPFCFTHTDANCIEITLKQAIKKGLKPCTKCIN